MKKGDVLAIAAVLLLAAGIVAAQALSLRGEDAVTVEIYLSGERIYSAPISSDAVVPVSGSCDAEVIVEGGEVFVARSDCPDGDCLRMGRRSRAGESIFCLPNRLEIRLVGSDLDMVAG